MNRDHEIYRAQEDEIPVEDKARLDGFLAGRAEATEIERAKAEFARAQEKMATSIPTKR